MLEYYNKPMCEETNVTYILPFPEGQESLWCSRVQNDLIDPSASMNSLWRTLHTPLHALLFLWAIRITLHTLCSLQEWRGTFCWSYAATYMPYLTRLPRIFREFAITFLLPDNYFRYYKTSRSTISVKITICISKTFL